MLNNLVSGKLVRWVFFIAFVFLISVPATASYQRGLQLEAEGDYARALRSFQNYYRDNPTHSPSVLGKLRTAIKLEKYSLAEEALTDYEKLEPETPIAANLAARLYFYQEKYDTALLWANRFKERDPGSWEPYHFLAQIHLARKAYIDAREAVFSAARRSRNNPWVMMDEFIVRLTLSDDYDENLLEKIVNSADNPVIFWHIARQPQLGGQGEKIIELLEEGLRFFPAAEPPFLSPVKNGWYRYWLARHHYLIGNMSRAGEVSQGIKAQKRVRWLRVLLSQNSTRRLKLLNKLLGDWPDNILYQWQYSLDSRRVEQLGGENRSRAADFFFKEFEYLNDMFLSAASLAALKRSLELNPLDAERQFELARFFKELGWEKSEGRVLQRVRELGITPPERIEDYLEGFEVPEASKQGIAPSTGTIVFRVKTASGWKVPPGAGELIASMIRQSFYHQPAFKIITRPREVDEARPLGDLLAAAGADAAFEINLLEWSHRYRAEINYLFAGGQVKKRTFYDNRRIGIWKLLNEIIFMLRDNWDWQGEIYSLDRQGAGVNLGLIHGISEEDNFFVSDYSLPVGTLREENLTLSFPSPIISGRLERGIKARLHQND